jgi:hypothetical protein
MDAAHAPFRLQEFFPPSPHPQSFLKNEMTADVHTARDFDKHTKTLDQAEKAGDMIHRAESDPSTRRMGISLVKQYEGSRGTLVEDEIFGPILPIIGVKVGGQFEAFKFMTLLGVKNSPTINITSLPATHPL